MLKYSLGGMHKVDILHHLNTVIHLFRGRSIGFNLNTRNRLLTLV